MTSSGLTEAGDWRFGKGRAVYLRRSDAIRQNVVTRLRSFTDDWFLDIAAGIDWIELMGRKDTEARILRDIERTVLTTEGVRSIQSLRLVEIDQDRGATIELSATDIFDERIDETVSVTP